MTQMKSPKKTKASGKKKISIFPVWVLVMVALTQIWLVRNHLLSPWKGGGFGMFAVADAPGTRFLTFDALDTEGQIMMIDAQNYWSGNKKRFLQSMPTQKYLETMADNLMKESFVPVGNRFSRALQTYREQNPGAELPDIAMESLAGETVYRVSRSSDDPQTLAQAKKLNALRVTLWRVVYQGDKHSIHAEPLLKPALRGGFSE